MTAKEIFETFVQEDLNRGIKIGHSSDDNITAADILFMSFEEYLRENDLDWSIKYAITDEEYEEAAKRYPKV